VEARSAQTTIGMSWALCRLSHLYIMCRPHHCFCL